MTTATASKTDAKRQELLKKRAQVEKLMKTYVELRARQLSIDDDWTKELQPYTEEFERKTKGINEKYEKQLDGLVEEIQDTKEKLLEIAGEKDKKGNLVNRALFTDGNWHFEDCDGHYLHIRTEAVPEFAPDFSLSKFVKKFADYVTVKFKIAELKKIFTDGDQRAKFTALGFDLKNQESVEIKQKTERA